ncbi:MAG: hypothetical protein U0230_08500 [Polyangiales bacterium]
MRAPVRPLRRTGASSFLAFTALLALAGCESCLKRVPIAEVDDLGYPSCETAPSETRVVTASRMRSGPTMREKDVVEDFRLEQRGCHYVATVHQEWERSVSDVEVIYDLDWKPLRAWKRMLLPAPSGHEPLVDIRRYELREEPATLFARTPGGVERYWFRGGRPVAVVGPGRGLLTPWIRAAHLAVGGQVRGPVLDFRRPVERVYEVALRRDPDRYEPSLRRTVRVYTVFGRESVFADETDTVIGDLAGLRPAASVRAPEPAPLPTPGPPDPVHTP